MARRNRPENGNSASQNTGAHSRRDFLKGATAAAAGVMAVAPARAENPNLLPTVALGPHRVTRLISGGNPLRGFSHFNRIYDRHMLEFFTEDRAVQYLLDCEKAGINTMQSSFYASRLPKQLARVREAGGKMQWICLAAPWDAGGPENREPNPATIVAGSMKCAEIVSKLKPIAIAHHGDALDFLWRAGRIDELKDFIHKVHDLGFPAGLSTHNPVILEALESKGWAHDFYMTSLYYLSRQPQDFEKEIGVVPVGETYLATDPPKMCQGVRQVSKPCLVYKLLAGGRRCDSQEEVRRALEFALQNIKSSDAVIVGMYPRFSDQITDNVRMVREILGPRGEQGRQS